jgi:phenylalanyl-tRNA synthetase alpha chain
MTVTEALIDELRARALSDLADQPARGGALDAWEREHLGRQGELSHCRAQLGSAPADRRPALGRCLAQACADLSDALALRRQSLVCDRANLEPVPRPIDPGQHVPAAASYRPHPISALTDEIAHFFGRLGFSRHESGQLEDEVHSFDLLGVPAGHPTRSPHSTFYTRDGAILRGHTTASVMRLLRERPGCEVLRALIGGPCHRNTIPGPRFVTQFHQMEAVAVGPRVRISDLKGIAMSLVEDVLGPDVRPRLRNRMLPYVSFGLAVDVDCTPCGSAGCGLCLGAGRLEIISGGMLSREALAAALVAPESRAMCVAVSLERVLAIRHRVMDIRHFLHNDLRVLAQTY